MKVTELTQLIIENIKGDVDIFSLPDSEPSIMYNIDMNQVINIMEETEDGQRLRFVVTIEDVNK